MLQKLKNFYHLLLAILALIFFRFPARKLTVIGVTGTDGKTTTIHLIGAILEKAGFKVAMISTLGAWLGEKKIQTGFHVTTPDSWPLQKLLRQIVDGGFTHVVLEATSHGLDQHRLLGCNFRVGVLTNVTQEHLDYHRTYENYLATKAKLFRHVQVAVLNCDDQSYSFMSRVTCRISHLITYGIKNKALPAGRQADITPQTCPFKTKLPGEYNLYNCLAAVATASGLGIEKEIIKKAIEGFSGLSGRLEEIDEGQEFKVFVDFAHTPAALEEVLKTVRRQTKGKIIHVFGCTGERDKSKRPVMGEISARLADIIILTHEDTYGEEPEKIISEIEPGVKKEGKVFEKNYWQVLDRARAIQQAVEMAKTGDTVLISGVGHQTTLNLGGREVPWSDKEAAREAIKEKLK